MIEAARVEAHAVEPQLDLRIRQATEGMQEASNPSTSAVSASLV